MKRPQPDIADRLRNEFIGNLKTIRGLKRLWGTTVINGVEVITPRQYYHKEADKSANYEKLFKFLGAYKEVEKGRYDGIEKAWFYFNKNKGTDLLIDFNSFVSDNLNKMWWDDADGVRPTNLTLTTSIVIDTYSDDAIKRSRIRNLLDPNNPISIITQSIKDNFEELWDICKITQEGVGIINKGSTYDTVNNVSVPDEDDLTPNDPWLSTIARYALRDAGVSSSVKKVAIGSSRIAVGNLRSLYSHTYVVDIEIPYTEFSSGELFVESIANDLSKDYGKDNKSNGFMTKQVIKAMSSVDLEDDVDIVTRDYILWEDEATDSLGITDALWFKFGNKWYLRAEPFSSPKAYGLNYKKLSSYVLQLLDNDFKKKKVPWWKKAIAVIVFIVAVILAVIPGTQQASVGLLTVAKGILVASLVLTLSMLVFSAIGMHEWASAFMQTSKWVEPLTFIATLVVLVDGINQAIEKAAEAGVQKNAFDVVLDSITDSITDMAENILKGAVDVYKGEILSSAALSFTTKLFKVVNYVNNAKLKTILDKNKDLKAEYDKLNEELTQESDVLQGFMRIYGKPATADWSIYASQFDMPYERGGGTLALGNIQRTTKQALRKADYEDPAFAGILLI